MEATTLETLRLFVEKADEMGRGNFWRFLRGQEIGLSFGMDRQGHMVDTGCVVPNTEALAALLLPLRMFLQEKDQVSLPAVRRLLRHDRVALPDQTRRRVTAQIEGMNRQMAAPLLGASDVVSVPELLTGPNTTVLTQRDVLKTFLYGHYAHTDALLRPRYLAWKRSPRFAFFEFAFVATVGEQVCTILNVADLLRDEIGSAAS